MKHVLTSAIDFFYPPFKKIMPQQTFRYAACGGGNALLGLLVFTIGFRFIFNESHFDMGFMVFQPYSAALLVSSAVTFVIGFLTNKYVVFTSSYLRGRVQLFRYFVSFSINVFLNYALLKWLVEILHFSPIFSQVISICVVIAISYITQRHFTFRAKKTS